MGRVVVALALVGLAAAGAVADTLAESLAALKQRTKAYHESLERLVTIQEQEAVRADMAADRYRGLLERGLVSKRDVEDAERAAGEARAKADETWTRIVEANRIALEAETQAQLALLPRPRIGEMLVTPGVIEYAGAAAWSLAQAGSLSQFFETRFGRPLPVSALGQTLVHDRLGFDHRNALDVAIHPDSMEGRALLDHLKTRGVPFLAFRGAVVGQSTGAHVHIGAPSPRKG